MIEFTPDGPYSKKADQLFPGRVRILGLGQTGAAACDQLVLHGRAGQDLWVFDSDQLSVEGSVVPKKHLLGRELVHGLGCNGDIELAREIVALEEDVIGPAALGCDFLVIALGLAGATGVALAERFIELGHDAGAKVIIVGVQPFAFEGATRRARAIEAIADLRALADSVLVLSQDRIADDPVTVKNIRHGFHLMHQHMARAAQALAQVVCKRGLIQLSFADVRSLYGRYTGSEALENCWVAHVDGDIHDRPVDLVAQLLTAPMIADESIWKHVDHAIVAVSGTHELGLSDVQEMVGLFKERLPVNLPIATSASLDDENNESVRMTVLLAMTAPARPSMPEITAALENPPQPKANIDPSVTEVPIRKMAIKKFAPPPPPPEPVVEAEEIPAPAVADEEELMPSAMTEPPVSSGPTQPARGGRFEAKQEEMSFEAPPRGRFEKTHETMYRGENLDQPTFRRRGIKIRV
jgi:cell division protein FtsZ